MKRLILVFLPFILQGAFSLSSPTANQVTTATSIPLSVTQVPAATDRVQYYAEGVPLEPCGLVMNPITLGCIQSAGPWSTTYYTMAQGESPVAVYAVALDVFGNTLATTATNTFTTRNMGSSIWFLNSFAGALSGMVTLQVANNHPWNYPFFKEICAVDGRINTGQAPFNSDFISPGSALSGPPYGYSWTLKTFRFPNGTHEIYCSTWNGDPSYVAGSSMTFSNTAINTSTGVITLGYHPLVNARSSAIGQPGIVTLTTTGTCAVGLTCNGTTPFYVVGSVQSNVPASTDSIQLSATVGGSPIIPSTQGTGTYTISYSIPQPWYCDEAPSDCTPTETFTLSPVAHTRVLVTFSNGATAMEMRAAQTDCYLTPGGTCSAAPTVYNTDLTTTAVTNTVPTYSLNTEGGVSGCVTSVSSAGLITAANPLPKSPCYANVSVACALGACNGLENITVRVMAQNTNVLPHFSRSGPVRTTYSATDSIFPRGMYFAGSTQIFQTPWLGTEMVNSGINYTHDGIPNDVADPAVPTCAAATSAWNSTHSFLTAATSGYGLVHELDTYALSWPPWNINALVTNQSYTRQNCLASIFSSINSDGNITLLGGFDEVNGVWLEFPLRNGIIGATSYFPGPVTVSGGVATFNVQMDPLFAFNSNGQDWVQIINATSTGLNGVHPIRSATLNAAGETSSFTVNVSATNGTYTSGTDPNLEIVSWHPGFGQDATCVLPAQIGTADITTAGWTSQGTGTQITSLSSSGTVLTVIWPSHGLTSGQIIRIWAATTAGLDAVAAVTRVDANTLTIPATVSSGTYNSGTDPSLFITAACPFTNSLFSTLMSNIYNSAGTSRPPMSWPLLGSSWNPAISQIAQNWNNPTLSQAGFNYSPGYATSALALYGYDQSVYEPQQDYNSTLVAMRAYGTEPKQALVPAQQDYLKSSNIGLQPDFTADRPSPNGFSLRGASLTATLMWQLANNVSAFRTYTYPPDTSTATAVNNHVSTGIRHYTLGEKWNAQSLAFNLIKRLEKYVLQPRLNSPSYGPMFYSTLRSGSFGNILILGSESEQPYGPMTVDLSGCHQSSGQVNRYRLTSRLLTPSILVGNPSSDTVTFAGGEVIAWICQASGQASDIDTLSISTPAAFPAGATKSAVRFGYYSRSVGAANATDCSSGCSIQVDRSNSPVWFQQSWLDSSSGVKYSGESQPLTR